jgi:trk system potassium uptake protein TrkH
MEHYFTLKRLFRRLSPAQFLVMAYTLVIVAGAALLRLPIAVSTGISWIDALFMSTSAVCVTGLSVVSLSYEFTVFGQIVIMLLVQIGALGVMVMSALFALILNRKIGLRNRIFLQQDLNQNYLSGVVRLVRYILYLTLWVELIGALFLFVLWIPGRGLRQAVYYAVFHSITAFANAGFDLFGSSLESFSKQPAVLLVAAGLIVIGGLGFAVINELFQYRFSFRKTSLHTKIVLISTAALIIGSWLGILLLEFNNAQSFGTLGFGDKVANAFFSGVTTRSAGFSSIPIHTFSQASQFLMILLMFIGSSPGSTGGGIKTVTFAVLLLSVWASITGQKEVQVFGRRIPQEQINKAFVITFLAAAWIMLVVLVLSISESFHVFDLIFETVSAFGNVGLSTGITDGLSRLGRVLLTLTMFLGRLGPMTLALALGQRTAGNGNIRYPEERVGLG